MGKSLQLSPHDYLWLGEGIVLHVVCWHRKSLHLTFTNACMPPICMDLYGFLLAEPILVQEIGVGVVNTLGKVIGPTAGGCDIKNTNYLLLGHLMCAWCGQCGFKVWSFSSLLRANPLGCSLGLSQ